MTHSPSCPEIEALDCLEFMPLSLLPMADPNYDDGEHQVIDAQTAYVFKIMGSRERAERIVATLNAAAGFRTRAPAQAPVTPIALQRREIDRLTEKTDEQTTALDQIMTTADENLSAPNSDLKMTLEFIRHVAEYTLALPSTSRCTCAAIINPNIPHARTCPLSSPQSGGQS